MKPPHAIVLASGNAGKIVEFADLLAGSGLAVVGQKTLGVEDVEETGLTFVENALIKARHAARMTGQAALADDSGICVDALDGAPGLYSARYAGMHGNELANREKLLRELADVASDQRTAHFIAVLVLLRHADDPDPLVAVGRWHGRILHAERGAGGFGYDALFLPDGHDQSAAELAPALKHRISHRGQAVADLRAQLAAG